MNRTIKQILLQPQTLLSQQPQTFIHDSFEESSKGVLGDMRFLPSLFDFAANDKDNINDETCELLEP
jgi:hypothetical protein